MTELYKLIVGFNDDTNLEISDIKDTDENLDRGFIRIETTESEWVLFHDKIKYLIWTPQSLQGKVNESG